MKANHRAERSAESLESALASRLNEDGLEGGGTPSDAVKLAKSRKGPGAETPGQGGSPRIKRDRRQEEEKPGWSDRAHMDTALPMGRRMTVATASPKAAGSPTRAAVIRLVIDNSGGGTTGGGGRLSRLAQAWSRGRAAHASNSIRVVGGRDHAATRKASI